MWRQLGKNLKSREVVYSWRQYLLFMIRWRQGLRDRELQGNVSGGNETESFWVNGEHNWKRIIQVMKVSERWLGRNNNGGGKRARGWGSDVSCVRSNRGRQVAKIPPQWGLWWGLCKISKMLIAQPQPWYRLVGAWDVTRWCRYDKSRKDFTRFTLNRSHSNWTCQPTGQKALITPSFYGNYISCESIQGSRGYARSPSS